MSKLVNDLHRLGHKRRKTDHIIVEDEAQAEIQMPVPAESKGNMVLNILIVLLIGLSAFSTSISLKTHTQLESTWGDSQAILKTLGKQGNEIAALQDLINENASKELARIDGVNERMQEVKAAVNEHSDEIDRLKTTLNDKDRVIRGMIDELQAADDEILKKFSLLNDKVNDSLKYNSAYLSTY